MDYRSRILAAIDALHARSHLVDSHDIAMAIKARTADTGLARAQRELSKMAREGLVVYDRKASGWRRA